MGEIEIRNLKIMTHPSLKNMIQMHSFFMVTSIVTFLLRGRALNICVKPIPSCFAAPTAVGLQKDTVLRSQHQCFMNCHI